MANNTAFDADFSAYLDKFGLSSSAPPHDSSLSLYFLDTRTQELVYESGHAHQGVSEQVEIATSGLIKGASTTSANMDLSSTEEGFEIVYFPSAQLLCLGFIGAPKTEFCTCAT
eukprot:11459617-Ditylum_brightwellii.AAC.1